MELSKGVHQFGGASLNLIVNAADAMPNGGTVTIRTTNVEFDTGSAAQLPEAKHGAYVMVSVQNTGEGMNPEVLARATEPFFTTKDVGKGTGLGLSQVYGFVRQSDGFLMIRSELGRGATVELYLPRTGKALTLPQAGFTEEAQGGSESILVVEDDENVRTFVLDALSAYGYHRLEARSAADALEVLRRTERIDLLLTDAVMPGGMNGAQLAREARDQRPELKLLLTSGYAGTEAALAESGETVPLLKKPYSLTELYRCVREALNQQ